MRALALVSYGGAVSSIVLHDPEREKERAYEESQARMRKRLAQSGGQVAEAPFKHRGVLRRGVNY